MRNKRKKKLFFPHRLKAKHHPVLFRRLAFLWIFLIILEIGCPLFECGVFASDPGASGNIVSNRQIPEKVSPLTDLLIKSDQDSRQSSVASLDNWQSDHQMPPEDCSDECLCHTTPINALTFVMPKGSLRTPVSPLELKLQPMDDLPPPYQPPRFI